jgi:hypothetical protein
MSLTLLILNYSYISRDNKQQRVWLWTEQLRFSDQHGQECFCSPPHRNWLWDPPSLNKHVYTRGGGGPLFSLRRITLTSYRHVVPWYRMSGCLHSRLLIRLRGTVRRTRATSLSPLRLLVMSVISSHDRGSSDEVMVPQTLHLSVMDNIPLLITEEL